MTDELILLIVLALIIGNCAVSVCKTWCNYKRDIAMMDAETKRTLEFYKRCIQITELLPREEDE